jgi:hypothetical protein
MEEARKKIISKSILDETSGCRLCTLSKRRGYGVIWFQGKNFQAHRLVYLAFKGEIPEGLCVCHRCNNRACVNPEHLYLDTRAGNNRYMAECGRSLKGEKHPMFGRTGEKNSNAKLIEPQVREIFQLRAKGFLQKEIAKIVGISRRQVSAILRGEHWSYIYAEFRAVSLTKPSGDRSEMING